MPDACTILQNAKATGLKLLAAGNKSVTFRGSEADCFRFALRSHLGDHVCVWEADECGDIHHNRPYDYCRFSYGAALFPAGGDEYHITAPTY